VNKDDKGKGAKIITFPKNRIVEKSTAGPADPKVSKKLEEQQTKQFVETSVDDMSMNLLKQFYDMAVKTDKNSFTKDLALLVDVMRGLIYRDFNMKHPAQVLSEKMVELRVLKDGSRSARINYDLFNKGKTVPLNPDVKEELKDLNETGIKFDPDDDNGIT